MPTRNVNLTEHLDRLIERRIASGRYSNASEVVREGLRLLEMREDEDTAKLKSLRAAVKEGLDDIDRGDYVTLRSHQEIGDFIHQLGSKASSAPRTRGSSRRSA
jgi:antitoxin ParD1/3/4